MKIKFSNNALTTLFSAVTVGDTQIVVSPGGGSLFPELTDGNFFMITVVDAQGNLEIMSVTSRNVDTFTVNRAQENTPARAFPEGSVVELRLTAGAIETIATQIYTDTLAQATAIVEQAKIPRGIITMWTGATNAVPSGWALCDGNNGTPNLKDRFIVGAGQSYGVGNTGGSITQTPSVWTNAAGTGIQVAGTTLTEAQMPSHQHAGSIVAAKTTGSSSGGTGATKKPYDTTLSFTTDRRGGNKPHYHGVTDNGHAHTAAASAIDVRPPYYALAFIMKL